MPSLSLRIQLDPEGRIGPGKIALLENIATHGSISAAGRSSVTNITRASLRRVPIPINAVTGPAYGPVGVSHPRPAHKGS